jgi:hypothetical protein
MKGDHRKSPQTHRIIMPASSSSGPRLAFKYRSGDPSTLDRDLKSLFDAVFYASSRAFLNDPFEGRFDRSPLDGQLALLRALLTRGGPNAAPLSAVESAIDDVLRFVDKCGVFSLSYNPLNELIWAHYGGSHKGFCIGYDLQRLTEFEPNKHYRLDVEYSDASPVLSSADLLASATAEKTLQRILGVKSTAWRYEEEVRVVTTPAALHEHDYRAVKKVFFGLRCPESTRLAVMNTLAGRGVTYEQVVSPATSYLLTSEPIRDECEGAPNFKQNLAPIIDGAICPDYLKPDQKIYQDYLFKAAEIVRREPYCLEIQLVEFSGSKGTKEEPVIFVQYLRSADKWINHYLTLQEIDEQYNGLTC